MNLTPDPLNADFDRAHAQLAARAPITQHQKDQLLHALMHYLTPETRTKVMRELPLAYNAWYGREIMTVASPADRRAS